MHFIDFFVNRQRFSPKKLFLWKVCEKLFFSTLTFVSIPFLSFAIPTFKNEAVSLIKLTSIAGFISIMDLTKASDIIRNRTYEAFFPLIVTAIIYFLICLLFSYILDYFYKKINPRNYKRGDDKC